MKYTAPSITTEAPPSKTLPYHDYSGEVEEYQPAIDQQLLPNPYYVVADVYLPMDKPPDSTDSLDVSFVNITGRVKSAYQLNSFGSYAKVSHCLSTEKKSGICLLLFNKAVK